jgi:hypothetical protein
MRFAALLTLTLAAAASSGLPHTPAVAETQLGDAELMQLLVKLTVRKGYKDTVVLPEICENLGLPLKPVLPPATGCSVYQASYTDPDKITEHVFNVYGVPNTDAVQLIIAKVNSSVGTYYLIGMDAELEAALIAIEPAAPTRRLWSKASITAANVRNGLAAEIAYWRQQQSVLAHEPDRCSDRWNTENPDLKCQAMENYQPVH